MCNPCQNEVLRRLASLGSWADLDQVAEGVGYPQQRVADELDHLAAVGAAMFNPRAREWRLAGTPLARRAAQRLLALPGERQVVLSSPMGDGTRTHVALAKLVEGGALVMAEVQVPVSTHDLAGQLAIVEALQRVLPLLSGVPA